MIFAGIGGALLFMKSNTPEAVEFTFSKNDWEVLFRGFSCWGFGIISSNWGKIY